MTDEERRAKDRERMRLRRALMTEEQRTWAREHARNYSRLKYQQKHEELCARQRQYNLEKREQISERRRQYRANHLEQVREQERTQNTRRSREKRNEAARLRRKNNPIPSREYRRNYSPLKKSAQGKVQNAIEHGKLIKPSACQRCGQEAKRIEAHHPDYTKPLEVVWLCRACHGFLHRK